MIARGSDSEPLLVVDGLSKVVGGVTPPTWWARVVERMNARADGLDDEAWEEGLADDGVVAGLPRGTAVTDVSFEVHRGEQLALVGIPRAGVSALMRVLGGVSPSTSGIARADGRAVYVSDTLGRWFGRDGSVRESVMMLGALLRIPSGMTRAALAEILEFAALSGQARRPLTALRPEDRVRLGMSTALNSGADVFLLDATPRFTVGNSDPFFLEDVSRFLEDRRSSGCALVINASDNLTEIADSCQRAILLIDGVVRTVGTPTDIDETRANLTGEVAETRLVDWGVVTASWRSVHGGGDDIPAVPEGSPSAAAMPVARLITPSVAPHGSDVVVEVRFDPSDQGGEVSVRFGVTVQFDGRSLRFLDSESYGGDGERRALVTLRGLTTRFRKVTVTPAVSSQRAGTGARRFVGTTMKFGVDRALRTPSVGPAEASSDGSS